MADRFERILSTILTAAVVVGAGAMVYNTVLSRSPQPVVRDRSAPDSVHGWDDLLKEGQIIGRSGARVKIVEFGDYECPFCRNFERQFRAAQRRFPNDLALLFIDFPLSMHRFAIPAARASACAAAQGRFAQMHEALYAGQHSFGLRPWVAFASEAGVSDTAAFSTCVQRNEPLPDVLIGKALGTRLGVRATPTIIVNGWRVPNPITDSMLVEMITHVTSGRGIRGAIGAR